MRLILAVLLAGSGLLAQHHPNPAGFGSVLHPGTGGAQHPTTPSGFGSVLYPATGGPHAAGRPGGIRALPAPPPVAHPGHGRTTIVPYPVFYGGYYGYDPSVNAYGQPAPGYDSEAGYPAPSQSPVVIINQNFRPGVVNPVIRDYSNTPLPEPTLKVFDAPGPATNDQPVIYLIAMKDHTIFATVAYWVEGDTLNYVTAEGSHNRASLDLVDREFSKQLNDERHVEFKLPDSK